MGRRGKKKAKAHRPSDDEAASSGSASGQQGSHRGPGSSGRAPRSWFTRNRSDLRFLLVFGLWIGAYYAATFTSPVKDGFFPAYLRLSARVSGALLSAVGQDVTIDGQAMISGLGPSIQVERGCDAVAPSALFVSVVLASPVPWASRVLASLGGTVVLMLLNLVRIISLFLVRVHFPRAFDTMHLDVWQALFIFVAIVMWLLWASRASRQLSETAHATV